MVPSLKISLKSTFTHIRNKSMSYYPYTCIIMHMHGYSTDAERLEKYLRRYLKKTLKILELKNT